MPFVIITMTIDAGYIYLIKSRILGGYKVGKTTNPDQRFSQLNVPKKATVVACWYTEQMSNLEKAIHKKFKDVRVPQSEWFDLSQDNLCFLCSVMSKHDTVWTSDEYRSYLLKQIDTIPTPVVTTPTVTPVSSPEFTDTPVARKSLLDRLPSWSFPFMVIPPIGLAVVGADCIDKALHNDRRS